VLPGKGAAALLHAAMSSNKTGNDLRARTTVT
jgi:hypothetical protein